MINKTFNSDSTDCRALEVGRNGERPWLNIREFDLENTMFMLAPSDAPALALAILEAAGWPEDDPRSATKQIMMWLGDVVRTVERTTAEAEAQAKLEAEALELCNAWRAEGGERSLERWDAEEGDMIKSKPFWLAVARRAREINKEEK